MNGPVEITNLGSCIHSLMTESEVFPVTHSELSRTSNVIYTHDIFLTTISDIQYLYTVFTNKSPEESQPTSSLVQRSLVLMQIRASS